MRELPILCDARTVRAILDGLQTQDRRPITHRHLKPNTGVVAERDLVNFNVSHFKDGFWAYMQKYQGICLGELKPPYQVGDLLYVRETFGYHGDSSGGIPNRNYSVVRYWADGERRNVAFKTFAEMQKVCPKQNIKYPDSYYELDDDEQMFERSDLISAWWERKKKIPSIHMPKAYARIWIEVTGVRVERIQYISDDDAEAEGITLDEAMSTCYTDGFRAAFSGLWESIYEGSWERNDWIWVFDFKKVEVK